MTILRSTSKVLVAAVVLSALQACSTGSGERPAPTPVVEISPLSPELAPGGAVQFTASASPSGPISWTVLEQGGGTIDANGLYTAPATEGTYTVAASTGAATRSTLVLVKYEVSAPTITSFTASPTSITQGGSTTLSWTVSGATTLSIDNGVGPVSGGSAIVTPPASTTYTLTASNAAGAVTAAVAVNVSPPPVPTVGNVADCTALVADANAVATSPLARPGYLQSTSDPEFRSRITRVTGNWGTAVPTASAMDGSLTGKVWRSRAGGPTYSHDDAWNADQSLLVCKTCVDGGFLFMDGSTYEPRFHRPWPTTGGEVRWHPNDPTAMLYVNSNGTVGWWFPGSDAKIQRYSPSADGMSCSGANFGGNNGNPSWDGRRILVLADCPDQRFWVVDLEAGARVSPIMPTSALMARGDWPAGQTTLGGAFTFPIGTHVKVGPNWQRHYVIHYTGTGPGNWSVTSTLTAGHEDVAVDADGNDVTFNGGAPEMWNAENGARTGLTPSISANQFHTAGKLYRAPGWGVTSTEGTGGNFRGEILAQELKPGGRIRRIVHHRTALDSAGSECTYSHCAFGVPAADGMRVFYNSDWGNGSGEVHGYVADVREVCR